MMIFGYTQYQEENEEIVFVIFSSSINHLFIGLSSLDCHSFVILPMVKPCNMPL